MHEYARICVMVHNDVYMCVLVHMKRYHNCEISYSRLIANKSHTDSDWPTRPNPDLYVELSQLTGVARTAAAAAAAAAEADKGFCHWKPAPRTPKRNMGEPP